MTSSKLIDDFFEIHDALARQIGHLITTGPLSKLHIQSRGEPFVFLVFGVMLLSFMIAALRKTNQEFELDLKLLCISLLGFAFFGAGVDVAHGALDFFMSGPRDVLEGLFNILEEGGELATLSFFMAMCLAFFGPNEIERDR
ncbi:MAG: hypothetical protein GKR98_03815 [Boseongicola sp.]|nr:MAG: hypothetical protein GKR98_03815 [Boseongicola sp.]